MTIYDYMRGIFSTDKKVFRLSNSEKINARWRNKARADKEKLITASNSLVNNRHSFAHGKPPTATFLDIKQYYVDVVELIHVFDSIVC